MTAIIAAAAIGYLLGSIPFGLLLTGLGGYGDVRRIGSGNIGATNVLRTGSKGLAALTLALDAAKGAAAALIGAQWGADAMLAASAAVVIGHMFPVWLGFRGGKGLATALGVVIAIAWPVAVLGLAVWLAVAIVTRLSSLAALVATTAAVVYTVFAVDVARAVLIVAMALVIIARHHENIRRLMAGTESRISFAKPAKPRGVRGIGDNGGPPLVES
jgi:glycerol-3-phosphate acyltransferase PlsY